MRIAVLRETAPGEARVAVVPDVVQRLAKSGHQISIQRGAGLAAGFTDADYEKAGARVLESRAEALDRRGALGGGPPAHSGGDRRGPGGSHPGLDARGGAGRFAPARARRAAAHLPRPRARPAHHPRPVDGRAQLAGDRRRLQGGARSVRPSSASCSRCSPPPPGRWLRRRCSCWARGSRGSRPSPPRGGSGRWWPASTSGPRRGSRS